MEIREDIKLYAKLATAQVGYVSGQVEVTSACFQHCRYCSSWRDKNYTGSFTLGQIQNLVAELLEFPTFEHLTITGGDPQAWPCLDAFLEWWAEAAPAHVSLQVSTALARDINHLNLWRTAIKDLRVSLDAFTAATYCFIRGDQQNSPAVILTRLKELDHPNLSIIATMYPSTIEQLKSLLGLIDAFGLPIRKIMVMAGIGVELDDKFWNEWNRIEKWAANYIAIPTSFTESIIETRKMCASKEVNKILCWASRLGFHIKPNGDIYPCCLVGGEAVEVQKEFCMGNIFEQYLADIYNDYSPTRYGLKPVCKNICQYKQLSLNLAGEMASKTRLAIP